MSVLLIFAVKSTITLQMIVETGWWWPQDVRCGIQASISRLHLHARGGDLSPYVLAWNCLSSPPTQFIGKKVDPGTDAFLNSDTRCWAWSTHASRTISCDQCKHFASGPRLGPRQFSLELNYGESRSSAGDETGYGRAVKVPVAGLDAIRLRKRTFATPCVARRASLRKGNFGRDRELACRLKGQLHVYVTGHK